MGLFDIVEGPNPFDDFDNEGREELQYNEKGECEDHSENTKFKIYAQHPTGMEILIEFDTSQPIKIKHVKVATAQPLEGGDPQKAIIKAAMEGKIPFELITKILGDSVIKRAKEGAFPPLEELEKAIQPGGFLEGNPIAITAIQIIKETPEWETPQVMGEFLEEIQKGPEADEGCDCYGCECKRMMAGEPTLRTSKEGNEVNLSAIDLKKAEDEYESAIDELEKLLNDDDDDD